MKKMIEEVLLVFWNPILIGIILSDTYWSSSNQIDQYKSNLTGLY